MNPNNPLAGDQFIDPSTDRTFYFTGERWVDITSKDPSTSQVQGNRFPVIPEGEIDAMSICEKEEVPIKLGLTSND